MFAGSTWHEPLLVLEEDRASDLMSPCSLAIRAGASAHDALHRLAASSCCSAPVIDEAGRPVGVISRDDLMGRHGSPGHGEQVPAYYTLPSPERGPESGVPVEQLARPGHRAVAEIMTPVVFSIAHDTTAEQVIHKLLTWRLQRVLVTDRNGCLIGTLSTFDLLRHLRRRKAEEVPACFPEMDMT